MMRKNKPSFKENNNTNNKVHKQCNYFIVYKYLNHKCVLGYEIGQKCQLIYASDGSYSVSIFIHKTFQIARIKICVIFNFKKRVTHLL